MASILAATLVTQEQTRNKIGTYVRLHGLKNEQYNGQEGRIVFKEGCKAEVELSRMGKRVRTQTKNLSWMPTFKVSRCKTRPPQIVHITAEPIRVEPLPNKLAGTYYDILGVSPNVPQVEIREAYKKQSIRYHPDKHSMQKDKATVLFQQIVEAYECLSDKLRRMDYDKKMGLTGVSAFDNGKNFGRGSFFTANQRCSPFTKGSKAKPFPF